MNQAVKEIQELVEELNYIIELIEDDVLGEASEQLESQSGRIAAIKEIVDGQQ